MWEGLIGGARLGAWSAAHRLLGRSFSIAGPTRTPFRLFVLPQIVHLENYVRALRCVLGHANVCRRETSQLCDRGFQSGDPRQLWVFIEWMVKISYFEDVSKSKKNHIFVLRQVKINVFTFRLKFCPFGIDTILYLLILIRNAIWTFVISEKKRAFYLTGKIEIRIEK